MRRSGLRGAQCCESRGSPSSPPAPAPCPRPGKAPCDPLWTLWIGPGDVIHPGDVAGPGKKERPRM